MVSSAQHDLIIIVNVGHALHATDRKHARAEHQHVKESKAQIKLLPQS